MFPSELLSLPGISNAVSYENTCPNMCEPQQNTTNKFRIQIYQEVNNGAWWESNSRTNALTFLYRLAMAYSQDGAHSS